MSARGRRPQIRLRSRMQSRSRTSHSGSVSTSKRRDVLELVQVNAANRALVNYHHRHDLRSVWGEGSASSSDGQRFRIDASSLVASFYPRYFGFYECAITLYTHVLDHMVRGKWFSRSQFQRMLDALTKEE